MGAFIGYGDRGVWASNRERDAFLDWYAEHRCEHGDAIWEYCKSDANRWTGCGIDLSDIFPLGQRFFISDMEYDEAAEAHWPDVAKLLRIIAQITSGDWQYDVGSTEAANWRDVG